MVNLSLLKPREIKHHHQLNQQLNHKTTTKAEPSPLRTWLGLCTLYLIKCIPDSNVGEFPAASLASFEELSSLPGTLSRFNLVQSLGWTLDSVLPRINIFQTTLKKKIVSQENWKDLRKTNNIVGISCLMFDVLYCLICQHFSVSAEYHWRV